MISSQRLEDRINSLARIGMTEEGGVTRLALTDEDRKAHQLVRSWMEQAGMSVRVDAAGNLIGRKEGTNPQARPVVMGSHIDSVGNGGKFDGTIGVIGGIEVVQHIAEENISITRPVEVIAFCEEEGSRFQSGGIFGSRAMTGKITPADMEIRDANGISRRQALADFGLNPDELFTKAIRRKGEMALYLEMHIEQGPVLEQKGIPVGIVTGITGLSLTEIIVEGKPNHVGATPMGMRHDALLGACEIATGIEEICLSYGSPAVGTVGTMEVLPGQVNIVPGRVVMTTDVRDLDVERRESILQRIRNHAESVAGRRGLTVSFHTKLKANPAMCSQEIIEVMKRESERMSLSYLEMPSGAGHDAQLMAELADMGMIFVRSTGGSHNPREYASMEDITLGTELLSRVALHYLNAEEV